MTTDGETGKVDTDVRNAIVLVCVAAMTSLIFGCAPKPMEEGLHCPPKDNDRAAKKDPATLKIAVIPKSVSVEFWLTVEAGARAAAKDFGVPDAGILWKGPQDETQVTQQADLVQDMITNKVDAIVLAASDAKGLVPKVEAAVKAGIPVITIDSGVDSELPLTFVATDNIKGAQEAAKKLAELIGDEGEVGLIPFVPGAATSQMREQGFKDEIAKHPNIKLVATLYSESDVKKGMDATDDMLAAHPNIKGIFAANEPGAMGAARALETRKLAQKVKLVAFDAAPAEIEALKKGTIQALVVQNPFQMGYQGVEAAVKAINGEPVEKRIDTGVEVVTMENFSEPEIQKLLYPLGK